MKIRSSLIYLVFALFCLAGCDKDKQEPVPDPAPEAPAGTSGTSVKIEFSHMVDNEDLVFQKQYVNAKGDTFNVNRFVYYISNIVLTKDDGTKYTEPESYHLVDHATPASKTILLAKVPAGKYSRVSFMVGVDSTHNVSGAKAGDLDPAKGMFWTWSSGYIFLKLEGKSPKAPGNGSFTYHIGGFKGENKTQRNFSLDLIGQELQVNSGTNPVLTLKSNAAEIFRSPVLIDVTTQNYQMTEGPQAKLIADNYADMITVKKVQN